MYRPTASPPSPSVPPPPPPPSDPSSTESMGASTSSPRYVYLVTRLRTRKITMEEATELFGLMNALVRDARARAAPAVSSTPTVPALPGSQPPPAAPSLWNDDNLGFALLFLGAGAGLLAAGAKKIRADQGPGRDSPPSP